METWITVIPDALVALISVCVQYIKDKYNLEGAKVDAIVLAACMCLVLPSDLAIAILTKPILTDPELPDLMLGAYWALQVITSVISAGWAYFAAVGFYNKVYK